MFLWLYLSSSRSFLFFWWFFVLVITPPLSNGPWRLLLCLYTLSHNSLFTTLTLLTLDFALEFEVITPPSLPPISLSLSLSLCSWNTCSHIVQLSGEPIIERICWFRYWINKFKLPCVYTLDQCAKRNTLVTSDFAQECSSQTELKG